MGPLNPQLYVENSTLSQNQWTSIENGLLDFKQLSHNCKYKNREIEYTHNRNT